MTETTYAAGQPYDYPLIIKKLLYTALINDVNAPIMYRNGRSYSYQELNTRIHRLAGGLADLGVKQGEVVAVMDYDSPRYLECFFAIPMMGSVLQTVNWRLSPSQLSYTLNHAEAAIIIVNSELLPLLEAVKDTLTTVRKYVVIYESGEKVESTVPFAREYEELLAQAASQYAFPDLDENTKATTFYTTGTTGDPKGVFFSHRQLVLHTLAVTTALGAYDVAGSFRSSDVYMPLTPMFHVHAWGLPYVATMLGTKQVYPGKYEPKKILELVENENVTFSHCVPTILQMLLTDPNCFGVDLSRWKVIIGGAKMPKGQAKTAMEMGITVFTGYGMSETCPIMSFSQLRPYMANWDEEAKLNVLTKTGTSVPLAEIEVIAADGAPLPHDGQTAGEVIFRAPWLTKGYHKSPEKSADLWVDGYLHSGDVGHIDSAGYLQVTDRIKDVIKTGGEWVSSLDLENILSQHEAVLESAAIAIPHEKWGERPMMLAVLKPQYAQKVSSDELLDFMKKSAESGLIPRYGIPDQIVILESLPKTSVGKLNKKLMRQEYSKQTS